MKNKTHELKDFKLLSSINVKLLRYQSSDFKVFTLTGVKLFIKSQFHNG